LPPSISFLTNFLERDTVATASMAPPQPVAQLAEPSSGNRRRAGIRLGHADRADRLGDIATIDAARSGWRSRQGTVLAPYLDTRWMIIAVALAGICARLDDWKNGRR
jgi:hypothetical protein